MNFEFDGKRLNAADYVTFETRQCLVYSSGLNVNCPPSDNTPIIIITSAVAYLVWAVYQTAGKRLIKYVSKQTYTYSGCRYQFWGAFSSTAEKLHSLHQSSNTSRLSLSLTTFMVPTPQHRLMRLANAEE